MQTEKNKIKINIEEQIRIKEKKLEQEKNQLKILKKKLNEENRKIRNKRLIEKGAIFESIFTTTNEFTKLTLRMIEDEGILISYDKHGKIFKKKQIIILYKYKTIDMIKNRNQFK